MNLFEVTQEMCACNGMGIKSFESWPPLIDWGYDIELLEEQAAKIPDEVVGDFVDGEESEVFALMEKYKVHDLDFFLDDVFNEVIPIPV